MTYLCREFVQKCQDSKCESYQFFVFFPGVFINLGHDCDMSFASCRGGAGIDCFLNGGSVLISDQVYDFYFPEKAGDCSHWDFVQIGQRRVLTDYFSCACHVETPFLAREIRNWPARWSLSPPQTMRQFMFGFASTLTITFSIPKFSAVTEPKADFSLPETFS